MSRMETKQKTKKEKVLEFLRNNQVLISPVSYREIRDQVGISSTSVVDYYLNALEKEGFIRRDKKIARHIEVLK